jgi:protein arginine kinase
MTLPEAPNGTGEWLRGQGPEADIVISSRVRLARNLAGHRFLNRCTYEERKEINVLVREKIESAHLSDDLVYYELENANPIDRDYLVERHLISKEHAESEGPRGVAVCMNEVISIMVNEEDHLRMQALQSGLKLDDAWHVVNGVDNTLSERLDYAFSPSYGFLTACPTNVGTAVRVSVMMHLPALEWTKQLRKVFKAVAKMNLAVRGFYGEGTRASGDFYQISNQVTLGKTEEEIIAIVDSVVRQIIQYERKVRQALITQSRANLEDRVWRAYSMLRGARIISSEETMNLLSSLRMGINMGIIAEIGLGTINELFIQTQPAHLQKQEGREIKAADRDVARASLIRSRLGA